MIKTLYTKNMTHPAWSNLKSQGFPLRLTPPDKNDPYKLMEELPPILRTLLASDGTVTKSLESYFWEPINIQQLTLKTINSEHTIPWLQTKEEERLLIREVKLIGENSKRIYTTAYSIIRLEKTPNSIREKLENGGIGIGVLISQFNIENTREILEIGHSNTLSFSKHTEETGAGVDATTFDIIYRSYRIMVNQEPIILITEKFPKEIYRQPQ